VPDTSGKKARPISVVHSSIDASKLNSINMRSLTRAKMADGVKSPERKLSSESANVEKRHSSFIPTPSASSNSAAAGAGVPASKGIASVNPSSTPSPTEQQSGGTAVANKGKGVGGGGNTQVLYSRKPSFKVIPMSSSSHRIMHTVQDGGAPKRLTTRNSQPALSSAMTPSSGHQRIATGSGSSGSGGGTSSSDNSTTKPAQGRVAKETVVLRHAKEATKPQKAEVQDTPGNYNSPVIKERLSNGPTGREEQPVAVSPERKVSMGEYDRLSPPVRALQSPTEEEVMYDVVEGHENKNHPGNMKRNLSKDEPQPENHQNLVNLGSNGVVAAEEAKRSAVSPTPIVAGLQDNVGEQACVELPVASAGNSEDKDISGDLVPVPPPPSKGSGVFEDKPRVAVAGGGGGGGGVGEKDSQVAHKNLSKGGGSFGFQRKLSGGTKPPPASLSRYTARSGDAYSLVLKPKAAADFGRQGRTGATSPQAVTVEEITSPTAEVPKVICLPMSTEDPPALPETTTAQTNQSSSSTVISTANQHRRLQMSLSDSSATSAARSTPIFFKGEALSNESIGRDCSMSSSSAASSDQDLLQPHKQMEDVTAGRRKGDDKLLVPRGGVALMASTERRAKLAINWSEQSLNQNVPSMVTSAVEALGHLVGTISSPPANNSDDGR